MLIPRTGSRFIESLTQDQTDICLHDLAQQCPLDDPFSEKSFNKFVSRLAKQYALQLDEFDERECFESEEFRELYEFMGVSMPRKTSKKAKQVSVAAVEQRHKISRDEKGGDDGSASEETPMVKRARFVFRLMAE